jgi:hypothetical protein
MTKKSLARSMSQAPPARTFQRNFSNLYRGALAPVGVLFTVGRSDWDTGLDVEAPGSIVAA